MIPYGQNPHGLEDRLLSFHVYAVENGVATKVAWAQTKNRLYCHAVFPDEMLAYGPEWATEYATTAESYNALQKYVTRDEKWRDNPQQYMVMGNQDFYIEMFYNYAYPEYATVVILDTSGSMNSPADYTFDSPNVKIKFEYEYVKNIVSAAISEYACFKADYIDSKIMIYSGTYISNLTSNLIGSLDLKSASWEDIMGKVSPLINSVPKIGGTESMVTCFYRALIEIQDKWLKELEIGSDNQKLKGITFIVYSDESLFGDSVVENYEDLLKKASGKPIFPWFYDWQKEGGTNYRFSNDNYSDKEGKRDFINGITNALKQMSYYYGVNINWALVRGPIWYRYKHKATGIQPDGFETDTEGSIQNFHQDDWAMFGNNGLSTSFKCLPFIYVDSDWVPAGAKVVHQWIMPASYHVNSLYMPMYRVIVQTPIGATTSMNVMTYNDQFTSYDTMKSKWHAIDQIPASGSFPGFSQYCAFRFMDTNYSGNSVLNTETITLPSVTGDAGAVWKIMSGTSPRALEQGTTYQLNVNDTVYDDNYCYRFRLAYKIKLHLNRANTVWTSSVGTLDYDNTRTVLAEWGQPFPTIPGVAASDGATFKNWMISGLAPSTTEAGYTSDASGYCHLADGKAQLTEYWYNIRRNIDLWAQWIEPAPPPPPAA